MTENFWQSHVSLAEAWGLPHWDMQIGSWWMVGKQEVIGDFYTLKVLLVVVGLLFAATVDPMVLFVKQEPALAMMMSL